MSVKTYHLTRVAVFAFARLNAFLVGTLGLLTVLMQIITFTYRYFTVGGYDVPYIKILGVISLQGVFFIITSLIVGWIIGLVVSFVYNWWAKLVGGIKMELEELNS